MSAYIVNKDHILYLVEAAMSPRLNPCHGHFSWFFHSTQSLYAGDYEGAAKAANMLWHENIKSVAYRYPNDKPEELPGPVGETFEIESHDFSWTGFSIDPVQVLASCDCYEYQSCEHPEWETSQARVFLNALRKHAWRSLPGYEDTTWGAPKRMERFAVA